MIDFEGELIRSNFACPRGWGTAPGHCGAEAGNATLTYRVARLVEKGIRRTDLLATFTNKAARSMLGRVETLIGREIGGLWGAPFTFAT